MSATLSMVNPLGPKRGVTRSMTHGAAGPGIGGTARHWTQPGRINDCQGLSRWKSWTSMAGTAARRRGFSPLALCLLLLVIANKGLAAESALVAADELTTGVLETCEEARDLLAFIVGEENPIRAEYPQSAFEKVQRMLTTLGPCDKSDNPDVACTR